MVTRFHPLHASPDVEELTDDAVAVTFEVPDDLADEFAFTPGQSLTLRRVVDGVEQRRQYSISAPAGARPRVGVREIPDGLFSRWLVRDVRPGDEIDVQTPSGRFCPDPAMLEGGRHLCIAAGSGITPMLSVASTVLASDGDVTLLYGNRHQRLGDVRRGAGRPQEPLRPAAPARARALPRAARRRAVLGPPGRRPAAPAAHRAGAGRPVRPRLAVRAARDAARRPVGAGRARRAPRAGAPRAVLRRRAAAGAAPVGTGGQR